MGAVQINSETRTKICKLQQKLVKDVYLKKLLDKTVSESNVPTKCLFLSSAIKEMSDSSTKVTIEYTIHQESSKKYIVGNNHAVAGEWIRWQKENAFEIPEMSFCS